MVAFCGILVISTVKNADIIFEERVWRVLTNGPTALITAIAKIGSLCQLLNLKKDTLVSQGCELIVDLGDLDFPPLMRRDESSDDLTVQ